VFINCRIYNGTESLVGKIGIQVQTETENFVRDFKLRERFGTEEEQQRFNLDCIRNDLAQTNIHTRSNGDNGNQNNQKNNDSANENSDDDIPRHNVPYHNDENHATTRHDHTTGRNQANIRTTNSDDEFRSQDAKSDKNLHQRGNQTPPEGEIFEGE
jgi:hypothetical protein